MSQKSTEVYGEGFNVRFSGEEDDEISFDDVFDALNGDDEEFQWADVQQPAERTKSADVVELSSLSPERQREIDRLQELQGYITALADQLSFASAAEKEKFLAQIKIETGIPGTNSTQFTRLPEFGPATKEGFAKLAEFYSKRALPDAIGQLDSLQLAMPPGCPLKIAGRAEKIVKSDEQFRQEIAQGKQYLELDAGKLEDIQKIRCACDWLKDAQDTLNHERIERLERYLSRKLDDGILEGRYENGWRRGAGVDKATWCSQVEQVMSEYDRINQLIHAINHLQRSQKGFSSDALDNLPPGIKITKDANGLIADVKFDPKIPSLDMQRDDNQLILDPMKAWADKYGPTVQQAMTEMMKEHNHICGYGEAEISNGWVNPKTKEFVAGRQTSPGDGWVQFNLISYDMDIKEERDQFGKVKEVRVATDCQFKEVPTYGYLNTFADTKIGETTTPVTYKADDWVAVQTEPNKVQMIQAKDLRDWRERQQLKLYAGKTITVAMDAAMIVSGTIELRAAAKVAQLGTKEAVAIGGQVMKTEMAGQIPKYVVARQVAQGGFQIGLGVTGVFENAGAHEVAWMDSVSDLRKVYFLTHAGYSVLSLMRVPQGVARLTETVAPRLAGGARWGIDSIRGTEAQLRAMELARAGALSQIGKGIATTDKLNAASFSLSEKAFIGMFPWEFATMYQRSQHNESALKKAQKAMSELNFDDAQRFEAMMKRLSPQADVNEEALKKYKDSLGTLDGETAKRVDVIIARVKELSATGVSEEDKQKYLQELIQYLRYDGAAIGQMQNGRASGTELAETKLADMAKADSVKLDPSVRKVAAMAMLMLGRKPDGSWDKSVAARTITVSDYSVSVPNGDAPPTMVTKSGVQITQEIWANELVEVLQSDFRAQSDAAVRTDKAAVLNQLGLITNEHYGDMLLSRIEGKQGVNREKRLEAIVEFGALMNRLKLEESLRDQTFTEAQKYAARGLSAGCSFADLLKRFETAGLGSEDKDFRATVMMAQGILQRENLTESDKARFTEVFMKNPPGITEEQLRKQLEADAAARPSATDGTAWERKLVAAQTLFKMDWQKGNLNELALSAILDCLKTGVLSDVAIKAFQFLSARSPENGSSMLERVAPAAKDSQLQKTVLTAALNLFGEIKDRPGSSVKDRLDNAAQRRALIGIAASMIKGDTESFLRRQLIGQLVSMADSSAEPIEEVRIAAVKAIADLGVREQEVIESLKRNLEPAKEKSAAVRLATFDALELLVVRSKDRRDMFGPLAASEPDQAVKARLARYYCPAGTMLDAGSQASDQAVTDKRVEQNKDEIKESEVRSWMEQNVPRLTKREQILDYIDPDRENDRATKGNLRLSTAIESAEGKANNSALWPGWQAERDWGIERLVQLEAVAQDRAFKDYEYGIGKLAERTQTGNPAKTVRMGDQLVSDCDAAMMAMGLLVSSESRMGEAFYRTTAQGVKGSAPYNDFSDEQSKTRRRYAGAVGYDGRIIDVTLFGGDPWTDMQAKIAEKLADLASVSAENVNLRLLKDQLLLGLKSNASTTDESRTILIRGLDKLLSRPETAPEVKREILREVAKLVAEMKEADTDKKLSLTAMIDLLDKHGKRVFEQFSNDYALIRTAVQARSQMDSFRTPTSARLRAIEMYDREWQSVVSEAARIPAAQGTARSRRELLPKDIALLEKNDKTDGRDERVQDAVRSIIMATKGAPLSAGDPRLELIESLTDEKYNDRVRVAAAMAMLESNDADIKSRARGVLMTIGMDSDNKTLREDAAKLLEDTPCLWISEGTIDPYREKLQALLPKNGSENLQSEQIIADATAFVTEKSNSTDAREKQRAKDILVALHRYGEALLMLAANNSKSNDIGLRQDAGRLFKLGLQAFGIDDSAVSAFAAAVKAKHHEPIERSSLIEQLLPILNSRLQLTGATPALLRGLRGYALWNVKEINNKGTNVELAADRAIALSSLAVALGNDYYPVDTLSRADNLMAVGAMYSLMAQSRVSHSSSWLQLAESYYDAAVRDYAKVRTNRPEYQTAPELISSANEQITYSRLQQYNLLAQKKDRSSNENRRLILLSGELEKELAPDAAKETSVRALARFIKSWTDVQVANDEQKTEAKQKAERLLAESLATAARVDGAGSSEYNRALQRMWQFYVDQGETGKAKKFLTEALATATTQKDRGLRLNLLRQSYLFYKQGVKNEAKADEFATAYNDLLNNQ